MTYPFLEITPERIVLQQNPNGPPEPRLRMYGLLLALGSTDTPITREQFDAVMVLAHRIIDSVPIKPDEPPQT